MVESKNATGGSAGHVANFAPGGYDIALLSAGGVLASVEAVLRNDIDNAYCLVRPPGHHAEADRGMGFCIFNNIVIAALHARHLTNPNYRIAIIDYDVHHGNGTQQAFWNDPLTLFISLHQAHNYPLDTGRATDIGGEDAKQTTINLPLPPGSGIGAYEYAFNTVVIPALYKFKPDFIFVSSGFDASYADPLGSMMLSSDSYREMTKKILIAGAELCDGRVVFAHEGGYSKTYVPHCGLAVVETLCGLRSHVYDPDLHEVSTWGYQELQAHQKKVVDEVAELVGLSAVTIDMLPDVTIDAEVSNIKALLAKYDTNTQKDILNKLLEEK
jgi:acetoin utilization deacetylase AcuC-like enzyme